MTEQVTDNHAEAAFGEQLLTLGLMYPVAGGVQVDINAATNQTSTGQFTDAALCDHNCRIETDGVPTGHYECPAAFTLNKGVNIKTLASAALIIEGIQKAAEGVRQFNQVFAGSPAFEKYAQKFQIGEGQRAVLRKLLRRPNIEVNCFGGNPELHPEILRIIAENSGMQVNLTTTGGIFMRNPSFVQKFLESPPALIALSADDFESAEHIRDLNALSLNELKARRNKISPLFGQRRKAHEAVYVGKVAQQFEQFPQILFNLVVHEGNIDQIENIIAALRDTFPRVIVNPYPAQSAFEYGAAVFRPEDLPKLEQFIDTRIDEHVGRHPGIVPRLHYWLMLKAVFNTYRADATTLGFALSGYETWKCYRNPGAGRYLQVGASPETHDGSKIAGGHRNCFWNSKTVYEPGQVWDSPPESTVIYMSEMENVAQNSSQPCPGCLMPRLAFDMVATEQGMNPEIVPAYLVLRKEAAGF